MANLDTEVRHDIDALVNHHPNMVQCRDTGHWWARIEISSGAKVGGRNLAGWYTRLSECKNCLTRRSDVIDTRGWVAGRSYDYPEGYSLEGSWSSEARMYMRLQAIRAEMAEIKQRGVA